MEVQDSMCFAMRTPRLIPASFFGIILGLVGLGSVWRAATDIWRVPGQIGEVIMMLSIGCWVLLVIFFLLKWIDYPTEARAELRHPIMGCFVGLGPASTVLVALAVAPYSLLVAKSVFWIGAWSQLCFGLYWTGQLWMGGRDPNMSTSALYLPAVAGSFVNSTVASALGYSGIAPLFFGAGLFSWLAIEPVILHQLFYARDPLPKALRPILGIQLAPPAVGCVAYSAMTPGKPDTFAQMLLGYGLLQALILVRLQGWLREQPFSASYWAFAFGFTGLTLSCLLFVERGMKGVFVPLAIVSFIGANAMVCILALQSVRLLIRGGFLPAAPGKNQQRSQFIP
jgi:tellurite resistance protein